MTINLSLVAALAVGALAIYVHIVARRLRRLEKSREVERRHREHLTAQVERLEDRAAGAAAEPEGRGGVADTVRPRYPQ